MDERLAMEALLVSSRNTPANATPTLARFYRECPGRETFERLIHAKPCPVTGRPGEAECVARIRELVASD
jgi:hypothetical protein